MECYHFGFSDPGLFVIEGKLIKGVRMKYADEAVREELDKLSLVQNFRKRADESEK